MTPADAVLYFASKVAHHRTGAPLYFHASPSRRWVELHQTDDPIVTVRVRERVATDPPSPYFGWLPSDKPDRYEMVWPSEMQLNICFPYGPEVEEKAGRGRKVNLIVEEVTP